MRKFLGRAFRKAASLVDPQEAWIEATDDFVKWLCFANAGMLDAGNKYLMDYALGRLRSDAPILEIGTFCGLSANLLTHYKRKHGLRNRLITCDRWEFEIGDADRERVGGSHVSFADYKLFVRDSYLRNARTFSGDDLPFTIEATSKELFEMWSGGREVCDVFGRTIKLGGPLSFCYIDGNHSYEGAREDFVNCDQFLESGGFLLFDDSTLEMFGVSRLMPEVIATGRYRLAAQNPNHLFEKVREPVSALDSAA